MSSQLAREVADAVRWEGYLLYPYRASSPKNQMRWQFGVLGPPAAFAAGRGEDPQLHCECLIRTKSQASVSINLRFLQLVRRRVQQAAGEDYLPVDGLRVGATRVLPFDEAAVCEIPFGPVTVDQLLSGVTFDVKVPAAREFEELGDPDGRPLGRLVRTRRALSGTVAVSAAELPDVPGGLRLSCTVSNTHDEPVADRDSATAVSFLGAHVLLEIDGGSFISLLEPPPEAEQAAARCRQSRCWPVLTGNPGDTRILLVSPIILYDYPALAPESAGALFDSTEIDEILTLRVMTLTDEEKAAARATDPAAAAIIDRCESMPRQTLARMHGVLRDPHRRDPLTDHLDIPTFSTPAGPTAPPGPADGAAPEQPPWWDPGVDGAVSPTTDTVCIDGIAVGCGSLVRIRPRRRADAQDLFYTGQLAKVTAVYRDVDENTHVAVVLVDDPAADLHEWYGRYLYFGPEELQAEAEMNIPPLTKERQS